MAVFLKILTIIGIVLLSIIGIILLAILLVLFVPIRYKADGSFKDNKPSFTAGATWLLHAVSVKYTLGQKNPLSIKIFGFKIKQKEDTEENDDDFEEYDIAPPKTDIESAKPVEAAKESEASKSKAPVVLEKKEQHIFSESPSAKTKEEPAKTASEPPAQQEKPIESCENIKAEDTHKDEPESESKNKDFENQSFYDKIKKYIKIIESNRFKKTFEYAKTKIFKLLKHIRPRKLAINGEVGFEDPSLTGKIIAITSMLKPFLGRHVNIVGNFEEPVISIDGKIKGHITVLKVLWTGAVLYFNKNIRKIIKMFREV